MCVIDAAGEVIGERAFEHGGQGLSEMADWLLSVAGGEAAAVDVAIEVPASDISSAHHNTDVHPEVLAHSTPGSKTVVRLQLMHWTGMRPSQMGRLRPKDFRLDEPTSVVVQRSDRAPAPVPPPIRLAETAGRAGSIPVNR